MSQAPLVFRCECGRLLRYRDITAGECQGHKIKYASQGSFIEWIKVKWWTLTGSL